MPNLKNHKREKRKRDSAYSKRRIRNSPLSLFSQSFATTHTQTFVEICSLVFIMYYSYKILLIPSIPLLKIQTNLYASMEFHQWHQVPIRASLD